MTDPDSSAAPLPEAAAAAPRARPEAAAEPWRHWAGWALLPEDARADLDVLARFVAAARAVADHPALATDRKEAALAALAAPLGATTGAPDAAGENWMAPSQALAALLAARGLEAHPAWQILQAAGQDLRKTRYRDWSELLTWCRFAAAPVAALAFLLLGASPGAAKRAESLGLALQLMELVSRAPTHYRWLGRIYLPERWFTEARADAADLGFTRLSPGLKQVLGRALDQASALLDEASAAPSGIPDLRRRAAAYAVIREARARIRRLARAQAFAPATAPSPPRRAAWRLAGLVSALLRR